MDSVQRIRGSIQHFLWPNNIDILTVFHHFADEWHVLKAEESQAFFLNQLLSEEMHGLEIESPLSENGPN